MDIVKKLAEEFNIRLSQAESTVALIDEGNTIPFIARYRKEATGGLSDVTLRELDERLAYLNNLEERKEEVIRLIAEQGKLTEELEAEIRKAEVLQRVEDLYKPYKQKKATRASKAREKGLEPLALTIWAQEIESGSPQELAAPFVDAEKGVADEAEALAGALDIIAEMISDDPDITAAMREKTQRTAKIVSEAADPGESSVYDGYYEYSEAASAIPNHRVLAINRGEKDKKLKVKVQAEAEMFIAAIEDSVIINENSIFTDMLKDTVADSYKRLMAPSLEREMRSMLTERAEAEAVKVFAKNTESLLMAPPVKGIRVIAIDPGFRTGCKVAVLSDTGKLRAYTTVYPTEPKRDVAGTEATLKKLVDKYDINVIVIGNGTASRETEEVVAGFIRKYGLDIRYTIVNEAGASIYSASKVATEEYPDLDVTTRGAMSLGRRLQDPLAELVKIPPQNIGVGQYQHDINQGLLDKALTGVVENCVNRVGVDLNTASASLLSYVAGVNSGVAKNIVAWRDENGGFSDRKQLMKVPKLGEKAFGQCAGFLRIAGGKNPLDSTSVHPESYAAAAEILKRAGVSEVEIAKGGIRDIEERIYTVYSPGGKSGGAGAAAGFGGAGAGGTGAAAGGVSGAGRAAGASGGARGGRAAGTDTRMKGFAALAALKVEEPEKNAGKDAPKIDEKKYGACLKILADEVGIGIPTLTDIVAEIKKPARDPREDAPPVVFRQDVKSFEDLEVGMELMGTVRNVVDFGAFVDIGVKTDGLVHVSRMSRRYINHPMDVVTVGDTVKVWIESIDAERQKIGLTMLQDAPQGPANPRQKQQPRSGQGSPPGAR
ncbi:MAG: RNA-binding transcriptional accessory protein [Clostridiales Family XIII bacterium]|nr:RNA-binding transcriptional accessory protein [Clostridiales Family XIII bacterium]